MQLYYGDLIPYLVPLFSGLAVSIGVSLVAALVGGAFGILLYTGRTSRLSIVRVASSTYIEVIRNTPLLLQLYLVYFALPQAGVNLDPVTAGILALSVNNAAYMAEIYPRGLSVRAGRPARSGRGTRAQSGATPSGGYCSHQRCEMSCRPSPIRPFCCSSPRRSHRLYPCPT